MKAVNKDVEVRKWVLDVKQRELEELRERCGVFERTIRVLEAEDAAEAEKEKEKDPGVGVSSFASSL